MKNILKRNINFIQLISINILLLELIFIFIMYFHTENVQNMDLWTHLSLGKMIFTTHNVPKINIFSYTYPDFPFVNHHWGSEVIFYLVHKYFSFNGLIIMKSAIMIITIIGILVFSIRKNGIYFMPYILLPLIGLFMERTDTRPELFSYMLFSLSLIILYREIVKSGKALWILPVISLLWINLHISFIILPAIYLVFLVDIVLKGKLEMKHVLIGFLLIVALIFNPNGLEGALYPIRTFNQNIIHVSEDNSPFILIYSGFYPSFIFFIITIVIFLFSTFVLLNKKFYFAISTALLMGVLSCIAIRNLPFFALSCIYPFSLVCKYLRISLVKLFGLNIRYFIIIYLISSSLLWCLLLLGIDILASDKLYKFGLYDIRSGLGIGEGMKDTVNFYISGNLKGPIFNNVEAGSYLIYRLYPKERVFIDQRRDPYPEEFINKVYLSMQDDANIWQEQVQKYKFNTIIIAYSERSIHVQNFMKYITTDRNWQIAYFDDFGVILIKKNNSKMVGMNWLAITKRMDYLLNSVHEPEEVARLIQFSDLIQRPDLKNACFVKLRGIVGKKVRSISL
jgi:hypothetical protein